MHTIAKPRVLLAEDDAAMRCMLVEAFDEAGYEVQEFSEGASLKASLLHAMNEPDQGAFDIVVSDVRMPGMTGLEVFKELRAKNWKKPLLFITAFGSEETHQQAIALDADILDKPFDIDHMIERVRRHVEQRKPKVDISQNDTEELKDSFESLDSFLSVQRELQLVWEKLNQRDLQSHDLISALRHAHESVGDHLIDLDESEFLQDIESDCPWLVSRVSQLFEEWIFLERELEQIIESLGHVSGTGRELWSAMTKIEESLKKLEVLRKEELALLYERFRELPALD